MFLALTSRSTKSTCNLQKRGSATTHATGAGAASIEVASPKPIQKPLRRVRRLSSAAGAYGNLGDYQSEILDGFSSYTGIIAGIIRATKNAHPKV
jgi:hypothetical protein